MQTDVLASAVRSTDGQMLDQSTGVIGRTRVKAVYIVPSVSAGVAVAGTVVQAGDKGDGFGIRVGIRTAKGNIVYLSHNDAVNVKVGDTISPNQLIAKGGNTGKTIKGPGGDGSHIDLTVQKPDGSYYTAQEIKSILA